MPYLAAKSIIMNENKCAEVKEFDYYLLQFEDGSVCPYELEGKRIIAIFNVFKKIPISMIDKNKTYVRTVRVSSDDTETIKGLLDWLDPNETAKFTYKQNHFTIELQDKVLSCEDAMIEFPYAIVDEVHEVH